MNYTIQSYLCRNIDEVEPIDKKNIYRPKGDRESWQVSGRFYPGHPSGFFYFMESCFKCKNEFLDYQDIDFLTIWMCGHCGNSAIVYTYPKCCNKPEMTEIRSETSDGKWQRRNACKTCKSLSGRALRAGDDFNTLPFLSYAKNQEYGSQRQNIYQKAMNASRQYTEDFKRREFLLQKAKYDEYLQTPIWKQKAAIVKERDKHLCQMCLIEKAVDVHHITYERIFNELTSDLISVCRSCHSKIHNK